MLNKDRLKGRYSTRNQDYKIDRIQKERDTITRKTGERKIEAKRKREWKKEKLY
jgi:hypothetical protein